MIYLSSFKLSDRTVNNPNIYPYNVFCDKYIEPFVFDKITVFYGNNGSGKSTLLNIIANCLELKGKEYATSNSYGIVDYCGLFSTKTPVFIIFWLDNKMRRTAVICSDIRNFT